MACFWICIHFLGLLVGLQDFKQGDCKVNATRLQSPFGGVLKHFNCERLANVPTGLTLHYAETDCVFLSIEIPKNADIRIGRRLTATDYAKKKLKKDCTCRMQNVLTLTPKQLVLVCSARHFL
jgi:hypothetical protein